MSIELAQSELMYWLVIRRCPGMGPRRFALLLEQTSSLSDCFLGNELRREFHIWFQRQGISKLMLDWAGVEKDLAWAEETTNHILTIEDPRYPPILKEIASAPPILFVKGNVDALGQRQLAMVGSRQPTSQGRENAYNFARELAFQGLAITSGLAMGIDAASHEGALSATGSTIAVLGNGLDQIYPTKHKALAERITEKGALVSEFVIETPPKPEHFPQRNRIISGMSVGVLVVESAIKSGSLITANYALDQGREVFALPGSIHNPMAKGCHYLLRQGAKCVDSIDHILEDLNLHHGSQVTQPSKQEELSSTQHPLLTHIMEVCTPIDWIVDKSGLTVEEVSSILLELELQGMVACVPGGYIRTGTGG